MKDACAMPHASRLTCKETLFCQALLLCVSDARQGVAALGARLLALSSQRTN